MALGNSSTITAKQFSTMVEKSYRNNAMADGNLLQSVQNKIVHGAEVYNFTVGNKTKMTLRGAPTSTLTHTPKQFENIALALQPYYISIPVSFNYNDMVAVDLIKAASDDVAEAMYEQSTSSLIKTIEASTAPEVPGVITTKLLIEQASKLRAIGSSKEKHGIISSSTLGIMLNDTKATSLDYVNIQNLMSGNITYWCGVHWHLLTDDDLADTAKVFIYTADAIGLATGVSKVENQYSTEYGGRVIQGFLNVGATIIQPSGLITLKGAV